VVGKRAHAQIVEENKADGLHADIIVTDVGDEGEAP
jgi:hypothetical protein